MTRPTLLGHLAQFGSFSVQSEVLCTQGLGYLLRTHAQARAALADALEALTGVAIGADLDWIAEAKQRDGGIPDLEARAAGDVPVAKIEAKLAAELATGQLLSYRADLELRNDGKAAMLVVVPRARTTEFGRATAAALGLSGPGPWPAAERNRIGVAVMSWEDLLDALGDATDGRFPLELEQLAAMYRVLSGGYIAPLARLEELQHWRGRETDLHNLVDRVTRRLSPGGRLNPLGREPLDEIGPDRRPGDYYRRHVCRVADGVPSCFSIGVRDSFAEFVTPIWMRFHKDTGVFGIIRNRIEASSLRRLESGGHIWMPLEIPLDVGAETMVLALAEQAEAVLRVAYPPVG